MPNEDSVKDHGDVAADILYSSQNIPRGFGYQTSQMIADNPMPPPRGNTQLAVITNTSRPVLPANPARKFLLIQNSDPVGNIWVAFGIDAALNFGVKIASGGGAILFDNNTPTSDVYAIGDIAANPFITIVDA